MSANCSGTANGNVVTDSGSKGWNKNGKNRTALDTATFDYNWDLVADKKTDKSSLTKQDKFTNVKGAKGLSHHGDKSWPTTVRNLTGTLGSTAYARLMGQATVYPGDWWNHWMGEFVEGHAVLFTSDREFVEGLEGHAVLFTSDSLARSWADAGVQRGARIRN